MYYERANKSAIQFGIAIYTSEIHPGHKPTMRLVEDNYNWTARLKVPFVLNQVESKARIAAAIDRNDKKAVTMYKAILDDQLSQPCPN